MKRFTKITAGFLVAIMLLSTMVLSVTAYNGNGSAAELFGFGSNSLIGRLIQKIESEEQTKAQEEYLEAQKLTLAGTDTITQLTNVAGSASVSVTTSTSQKANLIDNNTYTSWTYKKDAGATQTVTLTFATAIDLSALSIPLVNYKAGSGVSSVSYSGATSGTLSGSTVSSVYTASISSTITGVKKIVITFINSRKSTAIGASEIYVYTSTQLTYAYFPVTLYNYSTSMSTISGKTNMTSYTQALETELNGGTAPDTWNGIYFSGGNPGTGYNALNYYTLSKAVYTGIVKSKLDETTGTPAFNCVDPGLFDSNTAFKNVYTNVGLPFIYDEETQQYVYDSSVISAYFPNKDYKSNINLSVTDTYKINGNGDFFPFNVKGDTSAVYHFGMQAEFPFNMTSNGHLIDNDDSSEKVVFSFSGDDDVWVFLDGTLSLDLGGIHRASDGSINFADNTITVNGTVVGQLFNVEDSEGNLISTGVLGVTRAYYSTQGEHTLKVFYLERGGSLSNCKIEFNLPVNDQLDVKKVVDTSSLVNPTTEELAAINSADYEFTLYFVDATTHAATAAASIDYLLYNSSNVFVGLKTTTAAGKFTLKNGYTARFPGQIDSYYYVTETQPTGKYSGVSWDVTWNGTTISGGSTAGNYTSPTSTNVSLLNKADYLKFTCTNALDPYYLTVSPETYVLDYGLPTIFDVLANDSQYGVGLILAGATGATNGTVEIVRLLANGKYEVVSAADLADEDNYEYRYIRYTPNTFLDSVDTITYTLITHEYNGTSYVAGSESSTATVIPATSVYYEEDFSDITYNNSKDTAGDDAADYSWNVSGTSEGLYQESGLVSETSGLNSPYGSDIAYINSVSKDTNGTSKTVTTNLNSVGGATANMTFTFTGTGAAIYMRTDTRSGMIRVYLYDSEGVEVGDSLTRQLYYAIDTVADPETGDTLYNIPVYNVSGLDYGTYTVTLVCLKYVANHTLFKNASDEALNTYYVDGIEILDPLGTELSQTVSDAYETDGENDATTVELRDKLLADETLVDTESGDLVWNENAFVLFTDTDGTAILAEDYKSNGPKNELYLQNGQSVTFTLSTWFQNNADGKRYDIYLGMKVPAGDTLNSNDVLEFWSGDTKLGEIALTSTADCYYDIKSFLVHNGYSGTVTIKAVTDEIISLTNIKITCETYDVIENG